MLEHIPEDAKIYIGCGYTDLRRQIDGLAAMVQESFQLNPFQNAFFLFCGRKRDRLKALYWEGDGFLLLSSLNNYSSRKQKSLNYPTFCTFLFE